MKRAFYDGERANDRRSWPRLSLAIPVFVRGLGRRGNEILEFATILNVGAGGVLFASHKQFRDGSELLLEIPVGSPRLEEAVDTQRKFQARVLRTRWRVGFYQCAAQFKSPL
jgi:hypothetical protein